MQNLAETEFNIYFKLKKKMNKNKTYLQNFVFKGSIYYHSPIKFCRPTLVSLSANFRIHFNFRHAPFNKGSVTFNYSKNKRTVYKFHCKCMNFKKCHVSLNYFIFQIVPKCCLISPSPKLTQTLKRWRKTNSTKCLLWHYPGNCWNLLLSWG